MSEMEDIQIRMRDICDFITDAAAQVNGGEMVNLAGLDDDVASLCERAIALPPEEAAHVQPLMAEMISNLEILGQALRDFQDRARKGAPKG